MGIQRYQHTGGRRAILNNYRRENYLDAIYKQTKVEFNEKSVSRATTTRSNCGDFEHCISKNGDGLLELFDFVKDAKKGKLEGKALEFYDAKHKTLMQKVTEYYVEKFPGFANAFAQEFVANVVVNTLKYYTDHNNDPNVQTFEKCVCEILSSSALYESSFRNALNTFTTARSANEWSSVGIVVDLSTGINYTDFFDSSLDRNLTERLVRAGYQAVFNVFKNQILNKRSKLIKSKQIPYINTIGEQVLFDGLETYSENYIIDFIKNVTDL